MNYNYWKEIQCTSLGYTNWSLSLYKEDRTFLGETEMVSQSTYYRINGKCTQVSTCIVRSA